jgi:hypothetical protein
VFSIYSDRAFLASPSTPHAVILAPFWGADLQPAGTPDEGRFDRFADAGLSYLRLSSLSDCDIGVFPQNWEVAGEQGAELSERFSALCREAHKPMVVFQCADATDSLPVDAVVFRTSLIRSQRRPNEFALPAWSEDFVERYLGGELHPRRKGRRPSVGFCGYASAEPAPARFGDRFRGRRAKLARMLGGDHPRARALRALAADARLEPNFVLRREFMAGAIGDPAAMLETRGEYVQNMAGSDYVLCARGGGNFSYRLYETLSMGRIPIFVDTDCVLPLEDEIQWRDYCVWVDEGDIGRIGDRVTEFHESLDSSEFEERQRACRKLWETHISPQGFFSLFHRNFEQP